MIARALLADAPVYIMDEATSNIDVESEELIMDVIHEMAKTRTVLLISHRLANVVQSDQIYFLKNGEIRECGKHEELMAWVAIIVICMRARVRWKIMGRREMCDE